MTNGGLLAVRRRLRVDLGVGELEHRVLDRSRGRRRLGALERGDVEDVHGARPRDPLLDGALTLLPVGGIDRRCVSTPLKAAHVVARSGASPSVALWSMFSAKPSAFSMLTDLVDLRDRGGRLELRGAERLRVLADQPVRHLGLEVELGVGGLGRLCVLQVLSVSRCGELTELVLESGGARCGIRRA